MKAYSPQTIALLGALLIGDLNGMMIFMNRNETEIQWLKFYLYIASMSRCTCKSLNPKFSNFMLLSCAQLCILQICSIDFYVESIYDPIINQIIGSTAKINNSLQLCFRISCFFITLPPNQYKITKLQIFDRPSTWNLGIAIILIVLCQQLYM